MFTSETVNQKTEERWDQDGRRTHGSRTRTTGQENHGVYTGEGVKQYTGGGAGWLNYVTVTVLRIIRTRRENDVQKKIGKVDGLVDEGDFGRDREPWGTSK